jgi:hypothetical protein
LYLAIPVRRASGRRTGGSFHCKVGWFRKKRAFLNVMISYKPERAFLPIRRHLMINRPINEVISQAHRYFIAIDYLPKLTTGKDAPRLGARNHKPVHGALDMPHWNWLRQCCRAQSHQHKSGNREITSFHQMPVLRFKLMRRDTPLKESALSRPQDDVSYRMTSQTIFWYVYEVR